MWDRVVGQERAVTLLQRAAGRPGHAYLLVGARGSGVEEVARCLAAALLDARGDPEADPETRDRVLRRHHPDVVEVDPDESYIRVEHVGELVTEAHRSPVEGARKVVIVIDAERLTPAAQNKLLKTLEEPPRHTVVMLVTASPDDLLPTVRSRCQRVDLAALPETTVRELLERDGVGPERAELAARLAGGHVDRARELAGRLGPLRDAFVGVPSRLDGSGAAVARIVDELMGAVDGAVEGIRARHEVEQAELEREIQQAGYPDRAAQALRKRLEGRHRREEKRGRREALREGITAIEARYRDVLAAPARPRNPDQPVLGLDPAAAARALDTAREARTALAQPVTERLLLEHLLLALPVAPAGGGREPRR